MSRHEPSPPAADSPTAPAAAIIPIIPVIDLKAGLVVQAVGGRRDEYRPIISTLVDNPRPASVGRAFAALGFRTFYVADLAAIGGAEPAWPIYEELAAAGAQLWIDAGVSDITRARRLAQFNTPAPFAGIIAGLESLPNWELLSALVDLIGQQRLIFSLDLASGEPLGPLGNNSPGGALAMARRAIDCGVRQMIVLDLARVGSATGAGSLDLCRTIHALCPQMKLISGGGVQSAEDLTALAQAGCHAALVATALHSGQFAARG